MLFLRNLRILLQVLVHCTYFGPMEVVRIRAGVVNTVVGALGTDMWQTTGHMQSSGRKHLHQSSPTSASLSWAQNYVLAFLRPARHIRHQIRVALARVRGIPYNVSSE